MLLFLVKNSQSRVFDQPKLSSSSTIVKNYKHDYTYHLRRRKKSHLEFNVKLPLLFASFGVESGSIGWRRSMANCPTFDDNEAYEKSQFQYLDCRGEKIRSLLVCGDGDLSFSASIASNLASKQIQLIATVLENKKEHKKVYKNSCSNTQSIRFSSVNHRSENIMTANVDRNHSRSKVFFGIDATNLQSNLQDAIQEEQGIISNHSDDQHFLIPNITLSFDRIQFNFPHWKGKSNHKHNRALLNDFLKSSSQVLSKQGEIHVALCEGQGGATSTTLEEWRSSWTASIYAAEHGLLLINTIPFQPKYDLSSHRGVDRPFNIGKQPKMYIFTNEGNIRGAIDKKYQLCCRHELHVLHRNASSLSSFKNNTAFEELTCQQVQQMIQRKLPKGIRVEVPVRDIIETDKIGALNDDHDNLVEMAVFTIVYCGEAKALTRQNANMYREIAEMEILNIAPLRENRRGRPVSKPFPYHLLESLLDESNQSQTK